MATQKYPLADLLRIRKMREDEMANKVMVCRRALQEAKALVEQRKQELKEYIQWRINREQELYQEIMDQTIQRKDLDDLKVKIQMLREKELLFEEKIREAENEVAAAEQALTTAQQEQRAAIKNRQKLEEHREMWAAEVAKEAEYDQEKEMEDFRVRQDEEFDDDVGQEMNYT